VSPQRLISRLFRGVQDYGSPLPSVVVVEDIGAAFVVTDTAGPEAGLVYFEMNRDGAQRPNC
jgi:hypothetical protein